MKTIWKATVCIVAVLLSFSIYSCGDDDDDDTDDLHGIHRGGFPQVSEGKGGSAVRWAGGAPEGRLRGTPLALPASLPGG